MAGKLVELSAQVPVEDYREFLAIFQEGDGATKPAYGATTWFIRTALRGFLDEMKENPGLVVNVRASVRKMVDENRT